MHLSAEQRLHQHFLVHMNTRNNAKGVWCRSLQQHAVVASLSPAHRRPCTLHTFDVEKCRAGASALPRLHPCSTRSRIAYGRHYYASTMSRSVIIQRHAQRRRCGSGSAGWRPRRRRAARRHRNGQQRLVLHLCCQLSEDEFVDGSSSALSAAAAAIACSCVSAARWQRPLAPRGTAVAPTPHRCTAVRAECSSSVLKRAYGAAAGGFSSSATRSSICATSRQGGGTGLGWRPRRRILQPRSARHRL
ncbi:hypothetical protein JKP88DRAFT_253936 [Tribonema minus]|uniref:Uncharacterized protein n=1 Tax=Tribonema minus TaxID=303371 RepID=A0A836CJF0_9STRA|nr:hypothetical protein JKP88DRAFT_253936 [Tribonema minus]